MQTGSPSFANFAEALAVLCQQRATGELLLSSVNQQWHLYLFLGRLLYATGGDHRVRRWYRAVMQDCPHFTLNSFHFNEDEIWEYQLLKQGVHQNYLTLTQAKSIISQIVHEVLLTLVSHSNLYIYWQPKKLYPIALLDTESCLQAATKLWKQWQGLGLEQVRPDMAPIFKQPIFQQSLVKSHPLVAYNHFINGKNTIWDIALHSRQSVITIASDLYQLVEQDILEFSTIPDLPVPVKFSVSSPGNGEQLLSLTTDSTQGIQLLTKTDHTNTNTLNNQIQACSHQQFTGVLRVENSQGQQWSLFFYHGYLIGCATSVHPMRRWYRQLWHYYPNLVVMNHSSINREIDLPNCWDYQLLAKFVQQGKILKSQMTEVIEGLITEILFDLHQQLEQNHQHSRLQFTYKQIPQDIAYASESLLVLINASHIWQQTMQAWKAWQQEGFLEYSPNLSPRIWQAHKLQQQTSLQVYKELVDWADSHQTLRDLAFKLKRNVLSILQFIKPYLTQKLMGLVEVDDCKTVDLMKMTYLPSNTDSLQTTTSQLEKDSPLVAYIDDSQSDSMTMSYILTKAGYQFISFQDPVTALPMLLEYKPSLIFLDLVMPIANGYEICAQIRRISSFKDTPIIILTNNSGIIDRVRAKMAGSSDFLAKPIIAEKVLSMLQKHLPESIPLQSEELQIIET